MRRLALLCGCFALLLLTAQSGSTLASNPSGRCCAYPAVSLFDGQTLDGWVRENGDPVAAVWDVQDGAIHCQEKGFSIYSDREYADFELSFEWKVGEGGNSGVKYRVKQYGKRWLGLEYQMLDDGEKSGRPKGSTGSVYDILAPDLQQKHLNGAGEYNHSRIVVCGNRIEHWLNGKLLVATNTCSRAWQEGIAESKFNDLDAFGRNRLGLIMLQNHGREVWFRSVSIRELTPPAVTSGAKGHRRARLFGGLRRGGRRGFAFGRR